MLIEDFNDSGERLVTEDFEPRRFPDLIDGLVAAAGEHPSYGPEAADAEVLVAYVHEFVAWQRTVLQPAIEGIIEVHRATGIDLKNWPPVLNLVQSADPSFSIEGEEEW